MYSHTQQDQVLLNRLRTNHQKEMTTVHGNVLTDFKVWSTYPSTGYAPTYEHSPTMATPLLDNDCFSPSSSNPLLCRNDNQTTNILVKHYPAVDGYGSTFTGGAMELLVCESSGVNASPTYSSPSEGMATPLLDIIESSHNGNYGFLGQPYGLYQQELGVLQENIKLEMDSDWMDWPCYPEDNLTLFQESDDVINTNITNNAPLPSKTESFLWSPLLSSPTINFSPFLHQQISSTCRSTLKTTTTKKTETTNKSTNTRNNKRKRNSNEKQASKQSTTSSTSISTTTTTSTNHDSQQNDDDDDGDDKNNKKRSAAKTRKSDDGEKRFGCPICRRKFSRRYNLNTHIRTHNVNRIKEFACDVCDMRFDRKHDKNRHIISVHRSATDYGCQHCTASFCRRDALIRHIRSSHSQLA